MSLDRSSAGSIGPECPERQAVLGLDIAIHPEHVDLGGYKDPFVRIQFSVLGAQDLPAEAILCLAGTDSVDLKIIHPNLGHLHYELKDTLHDIVPAETMCTIHGDEIILLLKKEMDEHKRYAYREDLQRFASLPLPAPRLSDNDAPGAPAFGSGDDHASPLAAAPTSRRSAQTDPRQDLAQVCRAIMRAGIRTIVARPDGWVTIPAAEGDGP